MVSFWYCRTSNRAVHIQRIVPQHTPNGEGFPHITFILRKKEFCLSYSYYVTTNCAPTYNFQVNKKSHRPFLYGRRRKHAFHTPTSNELRPSIPLPMNEKSHKHRGTTMNLTIHIPVVTQESCLIRDCTQSFWHHDRKQFFSFPFKMWVCICYHCFV